jgi:hypothetical protein
LPSRQDLWRITVLCLEKPIHDARAFFAVMKFSFRYGELRVPAELVTVLSTSKLLQSSDQKNKS